jgi:hypothetical protein
MEEKWKEKEKTDKNRWKEAVKYQQLLNKKATNISNIRKDKNSVNKNYIIFCAMTNVVIFRTPKLPKRFLPL